MKTLILLVTPLLFFSVMLNVAYAQDQSSSGADATQPEANDTGGPTGTNSGESEGGVVTGESTVNTAGRGNPGGIVPCSGLDCNACSVVQLIKNIIDWLIGVMLVIFTIITAVAGFKLVLSGGNPQAKTDAKKLLTNAFIGIVIVLTAWLLIDTLMRALLPGGEGTLEGYGPWSSVQCNSQVEPGAGGGGSLEGFFPEADQEKVRNVCRRVASAGNTYTLICSESVISELPSQFCKSTSVEGQQASQFGYVCDTGGVD